MTINNQAATWAFASLLSQNLRALSFFHQEVLPSPPPRRLAQLLLMLAREDMLRGSRGEFVVDIDQQQLALLAGLSRQTVNRILHQIEADGLIECRYRHIVLSPALLNSPAHGPPPRGWTVGETDVRLSGEVRQRHFRLAAAHC